MNANEAWARVSANTLTSSKKICRHAPIFEGECHLPVVVKFVRADGVKEIQILKKLSHRNVVRLIESGIPQNGIPDHHYLALERCHDKNLGQLVKSHRDNNYPFNLRYWWNITKQIISGVEYIHGMKIIHKDLKPDNILITPDEQTIKIADFGISEELQAVDETKYSSGEFGTVGYRPPESLESGTISLKSDIFSLGAVICFTLSYGGNPFGDDDTLDYNIKHNIVVFPKLFVQNDETTEHLIRRMIESDPDDRPTIGQVLEHPCWTGKEKKCNVDYRCSGKCKTPKDNIGKTPKIFKMGPDKDLYEMKRKRKNSHLNAETKVSSPKGSFKETSTASTPSTSATSTSHRNEDTTAGNAASSSKGATQAISQLEGDFPLQSSDDRTTHEASQAISQLEEAFPLQSSDDRATHVFKADNKQATGGGMVAGVYVAPGGKLKGENYGGSLLIARGYSAERLSLMIPGNQGDYVRVKIIGEKLIPAFERGFPPRTTVQEVIYALKIERGIDGDVKIQRGDETLEPQHKLAHLESNGSTVNWRLTV